MSDKAKPECKRTMMDLLAEPALEDMRLQASSLPQTQHVQSRPWLAIAMLAAATAGGATMGALFGIVSALLRGM